MRNDPHPQPVVPDPSWRIAIIHSSFYPKEVAKLVAGAWEELLSAGLKKEHITVYEVPGSFEIPLLGSALASKKNVDALIGLGIIVEGETHHADLIARETARGIMDVQTKFGTPFAFAVLYVKTLEQAQARVEGPDNKGSESARVVLHCLAQIGKLSS